MNPKQDDTPITRVELEKIIQNFSNDTIKPLSDNIKDLSLQIKYLRQEINKYQQNSLLPKLRYLLAEDCRVLSPFV
ncbi:MAG: hypothetical protein V7K48_15530 [Nostoc sp.]|uniref:hypothetical protein n=1 Tax=Nostoc sp. TaxID=1180 RepID=UPI002FFAEE49